MTFKTDAIKPARQLFYNTLNNGYFIEGPDNPPRLSFSIAGPVTINRCGTYWLRAEQITGHGGRPVNYNWQLQTQVADGSGLNSEFFNGTYLMTRRIIWHTHVCLINLLMWYLERKYFLY